MPALQVRDFPNELYEQLRAFATKNNRSMAQQTIVCVRNEIERSEMREVAATDVDDDFPEVAPWAWKAIKEASARARFVRPWARVFDYEPDEVIEARKARRRKALEAAADIKWIGPQPTPDEIVAMIREDRDRNHGHIVFGVDDLADSTTVDSEVN